MLTTNDKSRKGMRRSKIILFSLLMGFALTSRGQLRISPKDSVDITNQIEGFYSWYAGLIKNNELHKKFNPTFTKLRNGMSTLDFRNYIAGFRKYQFTEDFIKRKVAEYKPCVDNLRTIPYDTLITFELDDHERIKCDFSNTYEWGAGMEPIAGAEVVGLNMITNGKIEATIKLRSVYGKNELMHGINTFTLIKSRGAWRIDNHR